MNDTRDTSSAGLPGAPVHPWVQSRLAAFASGFLPADEERAVWEHLRGCAACRAAFEPFLADGSEDAGDGAPDGARQSPANRTLGDHVPPALLWRFERDRARFRPLERDLVERHLERCESCREAAEFAGKMSGRDGERIAGERRSGVHTARRARFARVRAIAATAVAAALAIVVLRSQRPGVPARPGPSPGLPEAPAPSPERAPAPAPGPESAPAPAPAPAPDRVAGPFVLEAPLRSGESATNRFAVPPDANGIALTPPPIEGWARAARLSAQVRGPSGELLLTREIKNGDLFADAGPVPLVVRPKSGTLPAGRYILRLTTLEASALTGEPETAEYTFDLAFR